MMVASPYDDGGRVPAAPPRKVESVAICSGVSRSSNIHNGSPSGHHVIRRVKTTDEAASMRSRSIPRRFSSDSSSETPTMMRPPPRRSSNFSEFSLNEARNIINPRPQVRGEELAHHESSPLASLSLAFALLPAVAGALFKNGSSVVTDVMLLGLAAVFLHWSVTQPWQWYHAAQEVRIKEESAADAAVEDESDVDSVGRPSSLNANLDDVPEEEQEEDPVKPEPQTTRQPRETTMTVRQKAALKELYRYEVLALLSCFLFPLLSAYLLHAIRSQLSRPSEGLVSNYNLTIFLMISELRAFSHMIQLIQSRTLHLQRVVHEVPFGYPLPLAGPQLDDILGRLTKLEALTESRERVLEDQGTLALDSTKATVARDVRNTIQPELDALNRAVRRYEKKATLLQLQTESRFSDVHGRLDDAITLAATVAKTMTAHDKSILSWTAEIVTTIVLFPFKAILEILSLPLKPIVAFANRNKQLPAANARTTRSKASNKPAHPPRYSGDRIPVRVTKR